MLSGVALSLRERCSAPCRPALRRLHFGHRSPSFWTPTIQNRFSLFLPFPSHRSGHPLRAVRESLSMAVIIMSDWPATPGLSKAPISPIRPISPICPIAPDFGCSGQSGHPCAERFYLFPLVPNFPLFITPAF